MILRLVLLFFEVKTCQNLSVSSLTPEAEIHQCKLLYITEEKKTNMRKVCFSTQIVIPLTKVTAIALYTHTSISLNKLALRAAENKISHGNYTVITLFTVIMYQVNLLHHS